MPGLRYTRTAVSLHWMIAVLIAGALGLGWYMSELPLSPEKLRYYSWHKWTGVTIFGLAVFRAAWRLGHAAPPLPASTPAWQARASELVHLTLYMLIFVMPLSGWLYSSAAGYQTVYLGLFPIPNLIAKNKELASLLRDLHFLLGILLSSIIALHVAAALRHQFVDRDGLIGRMWFGR